MLYDDISIEKFAEIRGDEKWEDGREIGCKEGTDRVNKLNKLLTDAGRTDDLIKVTTDEKFQAKLFEEYDL